MKSRKQFIFFQKRIKKFIFLWYESLDTLILNLNKMKAIVCFTKNLKKI